MQTWILLISLVLGSISSSFAAVSPADTQVARNVVQTIIDKAKTLDNRALYAKNAQEIEGLVDFRKLATDALGDRGKQASATQRSEIQDLLRRIITKTVYPEAPQFFKNVQVAYTREEANDSRVHITSVVTKGDKRSTVEYWLAPDSDGYKVVDFAIEGERWVENVRDQFDEIIRKNGINGLIAKMKKRVKELDSTQKG